MCEISTARKLAIKVLWVTALRKLTGGICSTVYSVAATGAGGECPKETSRFFDYDQDISPCRFLDCTSV